MGKRVYLALCLLATLMTSGVSAQTVLSSKEMVAITPMISDVIDLPEHGRKLLAQKMSQVVTQNGFGSAGNNLILTANLLTTDVQSTGTVPAMMIVNAEASLVLVDVSEGVVLAEMSVNVKGIDKTQDRALIKCINAIAPRTPEVRSFMQRCRGKVIDYYTTRIPALIAKANSLSAVGNYDEAIMTLAAVPESVDEYPAVAELLVTLYVDKMDKEAKAILLESKSLVAQKKYAEAVTVLATISPSSASYETAEKTIQEISDKADAEERERIAEAKAAAALKRAQMLEDLQSQREYDTATSQRNHDNNYQLQVLKSETSLAKTSMWTGSLNSWATAYFGSK